MQTPGERRKPSEVRKVLDFAKLALLSRASAQSILQAFRAMILAAIEESEFLTSPADALKKLHMLRGSAIEFDGRALAAACLNIERLLARGKRPRSQDIETLRTRLSDALDAVNAELKAL